MVKMLFSVRYKLVTYKHDLDEFGPLKAQTVSHRPPLAAEARDRFQVISYGVFDGQSHTGTGFFPSTSGFSPLCRPNNAPYSSLSTSCSYQKGNQETFQIR
jgi:hypothetical protein